MSTESPSTESAPTPARLRPDLGLKTMLPAGHGNSFGWLWAALILLIVVMGGGAVALYSTGAWSGPASASAAEGNGSNEQITAALESAKGFGQRGEWPKAEAVLREIVALYPSEQELRVALAEAMTAQRRPADAYEQYEKALAIGPRDAKLEFAAGVAANNANQPEKAMEHFSMAQTADPSNPSYPLNLGIMQRRLGHADAAKASLLRAGNLDPDNAYAWGNLADIALSENNIGIALQHLTRARSLQPESKDWRLIEAKCHKRRNDPDKALLALLPMELSQRREPPVVRLIADCYCMLSRYSEAAAALSDSAQANSSDPSLAYDAAVAQEKAGDIPAAIAFAKRARTLGHDQAGKLVEKLEAMVK